MAEEKDKQKKLDVGTQQLLETTKLFSPSTYIGPLLRNNGQSYIDNVLSGQGIGDTSGNLIIDLAGLNILNKGIAYGTKTILTKAPEKLRSYNWTDLYNTSTKQWDSNKLSSMVQKGKDDAVAYFDSDVFRTTQEYNKKLAQKLGYKNYTPHTQKLQKELILFLK